MWSRFTFLILLCLAVVNCLSQNDRGVGQIQDFETRVPMTSESSNKRDEPIGFDKEDSINRNERQGTTGFGNQGSNNQKFNNQGSSIDRPAGEFGQSSNNRENNQHSTEYRPSNQEHLSGRPTGQSTHTTGHREGENRPSGFGPSSVGQNSFGRPTGDSSHVTDHREGENHPPGSRPSSVGQNSFGRPTGGSSHITDHREGENRPSGSGSLDGNSFGRPTGTGSSQITDHREGENRPSGSRPSILDENTFGRPTGGSSHITDHRESENRPSGSGSLDGNTFGRPTGGSTHTTGHREGENRPSGFGPSSVDGNAFGRPTGGSSHITDHREGENRPSGSRPSIVEENTFGRPTGGSSHITDHRESENRPSGSGSLDGNTFGRPTGGSSHITDHREGENRPSGSRPSIVEENTFGRPTGGSSHITDHREGENRPSGSGSLDGNTFGRPTGGSGHITDHREGENRPSGSRPTGESGHNQQSGFRPENQEHSLGGTTQRPDSHQESGYSPTEQNQPNKQTDNKENEKDDKEEDKDVCFTHLGCFKMGKPWKSILRPIGAPFGPEKIQTTVQFYSRNNLEKPKYITMYPQINMAEAPFDPSKITAMIVHGFSNSGNATWMKDMKNVYLKKVDANVMIVDWGKGAQLLNYLQVAGNTRVVGKQLGVFVKHLIENFGADPGKFHLIGHSLGAQICSYLGKEVQGIARLTALDPAQPAFEGFDMEVRLDKNDAEFVDVLHTDARPFIPTLGFGMITPHGHVDFYMNGGFDQPGCVPPPKKELPTVKNILDLAKYPVEVIAKSVACPHSRAYEYLIESFNETENCIFWGHKADVKNVFKSVTNTVTQGLLKKFTALSTTCSKDDCIPVGFATKKSPLRGVFVVTTNGRSPYCISEEGVPPERPPQERKHESFIQKIKKRARMINYGE